MSTEIANTIIQQLGYSTRRLVAMIGAHSFLAGPNSVTFRFKARAANGANVLRITLDPSDTYTMTFISARGTSVKVKDELSDVYAEDLQRIFESKTKLYLSL